MSFKKSEQSKKGKGIKSEEDKSSIEQSDPAPEIPENPPDIRTVSINVNYFRNVLPLFPVSDVRVNLKYLGREVGESEPIPVCDEKLIMNKTFEIDIDVNNPKELDAMASNAIFITAVQSSGAVAPELYEQLQESEEAKPQETLDSLFSMYEAFNGEKPTVELVDANKKKKDKKEKALKEKTKNEQGAKSVTSKNSKMSKKSSQPSTTKERGEIVEVKSEIYGMCALDLIPLFYGEKSFSETLVIKPIYRSCEILSTFKNAPEVSITVSVDTKLMDIKNILHFTVESICNAPSLMWSDMDCRICVQLPLLDNNVSPTIFRNPKITEKAPKKDVPKRWPGVQDIGYNANTTKYFIESDIRDITNKANLNLEEGLKEEATRIEFNYLKRNILLQNSNNDFVARVFTHKKLVLEIFSTPGTGAKKHDSLPDEQSRSKSKIPPYLHLMAELDIVALLYPGITKLHIAAPITTFTYDEAAKNGLEDSFFLPKPKQESSSKTKLDAMKKKKGGDKKEMTPKKEEPGAKDDKNLASKLPPKPEEPLPPEPSVQIYNEEGKPCFLIVELELLKPITPKKNEDDLKSDLYSLQIQALQTSKTVLNKNVADDYYNRTIKEIINDLNKNWIEYNETSKTIPQPQHGEFLQYLQKIGAYQTYLHSITTSATLLITNKYKCEEQDFKNDKNYQNLVSEVFLDLISQMHAILNTLVCSGMKFDEAKPSTNWEVSLFYAKEAAELKLYGLAERYFLERIINNQEANPDCWFDYAIFNLETNDPDKAFESAKESIAMNCTNKYMLLLYGSLLAEKENIHDAEICLLNILILESRWIEGWCVLYLFYQKCGRLDGMEMALDMSKKLFEDNVKTNYFYEFEDLAWSWKKIPDTLFFRTAILLLKMRLFSWAELALAEEVLVPKYYGYVNYMLAAVSYYKKDFDHALEHIEEAKENLGGNCSILALSGHILYAQNKLEQAKEEYLRIIESFDRPDDIHLVYTNCADILAKLGDDQKARKLLLTTCKYHQTPHVWFSVGKLYFQENDLLSAEECFNEANMLDNRHSQVWAYLTLVNLKLNRMHESEQCYQQTVKSKLDDEELNKRIVEEFNKINKLH